MPTVSDLELSAEQLTERANERAAAGDHVAACALYERAIASDPQLAVAHNNYALSLTALGRQREAWSEAEWRFQLQPVLRDFVRNPPVPVWHGHPMEDELIVVAEQGASDMLQYFRFLPLARERVGAVGFLCPAPLRRLLAASFPTLELLPQVQPVTWGDYVAFAPLLSLPHIMALEPERIPTEPYLKAPDSPKSEKIGIAWRSGVFGPAADCRLEDLRPLLDGGCALVSVQEQPTAQERALLKAWGVEERGSAFGDLLDAATVLKSLRALVTVDGPAAHLAGALGVPAHLLLSEPADVRWLVGRSDSPWYPSLRLHRKQATEPWDAAVRRVAPLLR